MPSKFRNPNRGGKSTATSISTSQRSTCEVVFYRFADTDITKLQRLNVTKEKGLAGEGQASTKDNFKEKSRVIIRNDVVGATITKNKGGAGGVFSITLKRGKQVRGGKIQPRDINYLNTIHPGDWVMIYLKKSGSLNSSSIKPSSGLKFLGVVENVRYVEIEDPNKAFPRLEYLVTGQDFTKVFQNQIYFNPIVNNETIQTLLGVKFLTESTKSVRGENRSITSGFTPNKVIKNLVSFYLGGEFDKLNSNNQTWYIPKRLGTIFKPNAKIKSGGVSFVDILRTDKIGMHRYDRNGNLKFNTASDFTRELPNLPGAALIKSLPASGTIWSVLQFMQNAAVNEMFTELSIDSRGNLQPTLIHRQIPFSNKAKHETNVFKSDSKFQKVSSGDNISDNEKTFFVDLPRHVINSSDIRQKNVGKSDHERLNHVIVVPKIDSQTYDILYMAGYNIPSIQRYGLKSLQTQTSYVLGKGEGIKKFLTRCVDLLMDWFFLSHQFFNGTIIIDGVDNHIEVGNNLYIEDVKQLYHIEGYTHTYQINADGRITYNTELRVSRGQIFETSSRKANFIGPSSEVNREPTTVTTSVLEGIRGGKR